MRKVQLFALMLLATVALVSNVEAKNRDKSWEFSAGAMHFDTARETGVSNAIGPEIRFGYNFSSKVEAEFQYSRVSTDHDDQDDDFARYTVVVIGNFLADRETRFMPFISAGLGVIQETRKAFTDSSGNRVLEAFDSSAILTLAVGSRTFFSDSFGIRYEARYNHHDSFSKGQDEYIIGLGVTWVVGGQK